MGTIEDSCRPFPLVHGTLGATKLSTYNCCYSDDLAVLLFLLNMGFILKVALTVRLRLTSTGTRRAPKVHPGAVDVRRPGEVHSVNIIEGHASHLSTWINPVRRPAAKGYEDHPDQRGKEAKANDSHIAPRHPAVSESADDLSLFRSALLRKSAQFVRKFGCFIGDAKGSHAFHQ